jgi:hypothetical protein
LVSVVVLTRSSAFGNGFEAGAELGDLGAQPGERWASNTTKSVFLDQGPQRV